MSDDPSLGGCAACHACVCVPHATRACAACSVRCVFLDKISYIPLIIRSQTICSPLGPHMDQLVCNFGFICGRGFEPRQALRKYMIFSFFCLPFLLALPIFCVLMDQPAQGFISKENSTNAGALASSPTTKVATSF